MSKFVRINAAGNGQETFMLNLDLVASVKLSSAQNLQQALGKDLKPPRAQLKLESADQLTLASFSLDTMEEGKAWVLQHLGIEL